MWPASRSLSHQHGMISVCCSQRYVHLHAVCISHVFSIAHTVLCRLLLNTFIVANGLIVIIYMYIVCSWLLTRISFDYMWCPLHVYVYMYVCVTREEVLMKSLWEEMAPKVLDIFIDAAQGLSPG